MGVEPNVDLANKPPAVTLPRSTREGEEDAWQDVSRTHTCWPETVNLPTIESEEKMLN